MQYSDTRGAVQHCTLTRSLYICISESVGGEEDMMLNMKQEQDEGDVTSRFGV